MRRAGVRTIRAQGAVCCLQTLLWPYSSSSQAFPASAAPAKCLAALGTRTGSDSGSVALNAEPTTRACAEL